MRYLALGDSFTIGTGTTPDRSFPAVLVALWAARGHECELRNPSVNGYTSDDLIRDELPLVEAFAPDLVTLLIGANDIVTGMSRPAGEVEAGYRARLRLIHARIADAAPRAERYALPQPDWSLAPAAAAFGEPARIAHVIERFNEIAREECVRGGARYLDIFALMREQMRRGMTSADGLHPSAEAYAGWARVLADRIAIT